MDSVQIGKLARMAHRRKIPAGQTIVSDGEPVDFFANIVSGAVKLIKTLPDGRQQIVGLLFAPDFLGLTIETVSRQLTRLKMANVILLGSNRLIMVPNADHLAQAAGQHDLLH